MSGFLATLLLFRSPLDASVIYVTNFTAGTVSLIADGGGKASVFATGLKNPEGVVFGSNGTLYVANQLSGVIDSLSAAGKVTPFATVPLNGAIGIGALAADGAGNLYVSLLKPSQNGIVDRVTAAGVVSQYAIGIANPQQLAFDAAGRLYAADIINDSIDVVPAGGGTATAFVTGLGANVRGVAFDPAGNLYVSANPSTGGFVEKFAPDGTNPSLYANITTPAGIAFDSAGNLLVASSDSFGNGTVVFSVSPTDQTVTTYATALKNPLYIAVAPSVPEPISVLPVLAGITASGRRFSRRIIRPIRLADAARR